MNAVSSGATNALGKRRHTCCAQFMILMYVQVTGTASDALSKAGDTVKDQASKVGDEVSFAASGLGDKAKERATEVKQGVKNAGE